MPFTQQVADSISAAILRYRAEWETRAGRKMVTERELFEFLDTLKADDAFWGQLARRHADPGIVQACNRIRNSISAINSAGIRSFDSLLKALRLTPGEAELASTGIGFQPLRAAVIREAFAAGSPAKTARILEAIAENNRPKSFVGPFAQGRPAEAGDAVTWFIIVITVTVTILIFAALGPQIKSMIAHEVDPRSLMDAPAYKGVTP